MNNQQGGAVKFRKEMSRLDLTMAGLGAIIGSGWLFGGLYASNDAGPAAVLGWVIGGVAVLLIGLVYAELSGMIPEAGGIARYPHFSHGSLVGFIMGWGAFIAYTTVPAIEAEAVVQYSEHYITAFSNNKGLAFAVEALLVLIFFAINSYGVKAFAKTNTIVTTIKFIMPTLTVLVFLFVAPHWGNFSAKASGGFAPFGVSGILKSVASAGIVFSYLGFRQAVDLAGEARNPQRDVPRAILTAIGIAIVLYTLLQVVFIAAIPGNLLAKGWASVTYTSPFAEVAAAIGLGWVATLLYADAVLSPAGTGNVYLASTARVVYAAANNRYLPASFKKLNERSGVPLLGLVVTLAFAVLALLPFPSWQSLVGVISSATVFTYMIGPVSASVFRKTVPNAHRPYRLGGMEVIAPLGFIIGTLIIYWAGWNTDWKLIVGLLVGTAIYVLAASKKDTQLDRVDVDSFKAALWLIVYLFAMLAITYFGSAQFGSPYDHGKGLIQYPLDLVVVSIMGAIFYYWGVASGKASQETIDAVSVAEQERLARAG